MTPPSNLKSLLRELLKDPDLTTDETKEIRRQLMLLDEGGILLLLKALYGTKDAGRLCTATLVCKDIVCHF